MKKYFFVLLVLAIAAPQFLVAQSYEIDKGHSAVLMKVQRFGVVNVIGRFGEVAGTIHYNSDEISGTSINISVETDSYRANNLAGETSAMSPAFLDAATYPTLSFTASEVKAADGGIEITGNLTIHGVTKEIKFEANIIGPLVDLPTRKQSVALQGTLWINRLDYGVGPDRNLPDGREIIGNKVQIDLEILAIATE